MKNQPTEQTADRGAAPQTAFSRRPSAATNGHSKWDRVAASEAPRADAASRVPDT
jgi:hypothetical protein